MPVLLEARALTKRFPGLVALRDVNFELRAGEIHALCGENGAGKSTLIKLLAGIHPAGSYEGELRVGGRAAHFRSIRDAETAGIAVITQEFALVDELSIAENLFLGRAPRRGLRLDWLEMHRRTATLLAAFGLDLPPETPVHRLGIGHRQLLEIVRAMDKHTRVLVLDEPTAALTGREVDVLLAHLRRLRAEGTACIYISHKLEEVLAIADRITVLRDGASVATFARADASVPLLIRHMVGRELTQLFPPRHPRAAGDADSPARNVPLAAPTPFTRPPAGVGKHPGRAAPVLVVEGLSVAPAKGEPPFLRDLSFALHPGEVLGFGGLMGAGRTELLMHLFGAWGHRVSGTVTLRDDAYPRPNPRESIRRGLVLVSEDRRRHGLVLGQEIGFNLSLSSLRQFTVPPGRIDLPAEHRRNQEIFHSLGVRAPSLRTPAGALSGGNQQKVVLGKALMTDPVVVLLDEPTRGIDVGAKFELYELVHGLTAAGLAVLLVSSELPELIGLSDRIIMLRAGAVGGEFSRNDATQEKLIRAALG